ncbi:MAG: hypothetical protein KTR31_32950 [Myxococcales bacterium]|nr:hypothetical protein [Myxococcales bacterium]
MVVATVLGPLPSAPPLPSAALGALWTVEMGGSTEHQSWRNPTSAVDRRAARRAVRLASRQLAFETWPGHRMGVRWNAHQLRYFGRPLEALEPVEMALVVGLAPTAFSPWCRPERALARLQFAMEQMGRPRPDRLPELLPPPAGACQS